MKHYFISLFFLLSSCQWIITHPEEDLEVLQGAESVCSELYEYETKTLSPAYPLLMPPMKQYGPTGL